MFLNYPHYYMMGENQKNGDIDGKLVFNLFKFEGNLNFGSIFKKYNRFGVINAYNLYSHNKRFERKIKK